MSTRLTFGAAKRQVREFCQNFAGYNKMSDGKSMMIEDITIEEMLNEAYQVFAVKGRTHKDWFWLEMTEDVQEYTLPHDMGQIIQVSYMSGLQAWEIREIHEREISWWRSQIGAPSAYYPLYTQKKIQMWPIPQWDGEWVKGYAAFVPDHIDDDAAQFEIPPEYEHAITHYVFAHMIYKMTAMIPEKMESKALDAAKKYMDDFEAWAEECRAVIEDKCNIDYQMGLDNGSEGYASQALLVHANKEARFTHVYFNGSDEVKIYDDINSTPLMTVGQSRWYWKTAIMQAAQQQQIYTNDETIIFKGSQGAIYKLNIYLENKLGVAGDYVFHGTSTIISEFTNGKILVGTPLTDHDGGGTVVTVTVSANTNNKDIDIRIQNGMRANLTITAEFLGVCV